MHAAAGTNSNAADETRLDAAVARRAAEAQPWWWYAALAGLLLLLLEAAYTSTRLGVTAET